MKITRRQLRKLIAESYGDMNDPYNPQADPGLVLKDIPASTGGSVYGRRNQKINVFTISRDSLTYFLDAVELDRGDVNSINDRAVDQQLRGALNMVTVAEIARDEHGAEYILDQNFEEDYESGLAGAVLKVDDYIQIQKDAYSRLLGRRN